MQIPITGGQPSDLPATKFYAPALPGNLLARERLHDQLMLAMQSRFTLLSAPAGAGKTTLLNSWRTNKQAGQKMVWLSLDASDNDVVHFWSYIAIALKQMHGIGDHVLSTLKSSLKPSINAALTQLCEELAAHNENYLLILDDYHFIDEPYIHDTLLQFIEQMPPNIHIIIATRVDPPLPLARLRAHGLMTEIRIADLRFTQTEIAELVARRLTIELSEADLTALETVTEGWVAGLQLVLLSMQDKRDITAFIASLSGTHRFIADYLAEEVLRSQPEAVQDFLLHTAHLKMLCGDLCDAVTGSDDGQRMLEWLERANLFLVALDDERRWYRYHHLFADFLRKQQAQQLADDQPELYARAAAWCQTAGDSTSAIDYALAAGDFDSVVRLIVAHAEARLSIGEVGTVRRWLAGLPEHVRRDHPILSLYHAWILMNTGQVDRIEAALVAAETALKSESLTLTGTERRIVAGEIAAMRGMMMMVVMQRPSFEFTAQASELLSPDNWLTGLNLFNLGFAYAWRGEIDTARNTLQAATESSLNSNNLYVAAMSIAAHSLFYAYWGDLNMADTVCKQGQADIGPERIKQPVAHLLYAAKAELDRERGYLQSARDLSRTAIQQLTPMENPELVVESHITLARALYALGDHDIAFETLDKLEAICDSPLVMIWSRIQVNCHRVRLEIKTGDVDRASGRMHTINHYWAQMAHIVADSHIAFHHDYVAFTEIRLLIAQNRYQDALDKLNGYLDMLTSLLGCEPPPSTRIEAGILRTLILHGLEGHSHRVYRVLAEALALAAPQRYVRLFADEDRPLTHLIYHLPARLLTQYDVPRDYIRLLLSSADYRPTEKSHSELFEALSEREIEVLQMVSDGYANQEIAEELHVSISTVKWHLSNIYGKLGVNKRTQAVLRARELELL